MVSERQESNSAKKQRKENKSKDKEKEKSEKIPQKRGRKRKSLEGNEEIVPLICKLCDKKFKSQGGYDYHVKNVCVQKVGDNDLKKNFSQRVKRVCMEHGEDEDAGVSLTCKVCDKHFKSQGGYDYHVENVCGDKKNGLGKKVKGENDEEYDDEECKTSSLSNKKRRTESDEEGKETVRFVCEKCNKSFKSEGGHKYHIANVCNNKVDEEGAGKFNCEVCEKKFKSEGGYKYHMANVCNNWGDEKEGDVITVTKEEGKVEGSIKVAAIKVIEAEENDEVIEDIVKPAEVECKVAGNVIPDKSVNLVSDDTPKSRISVPICDSGEETVTEEVAEDIPNPNHIVAVAGIKSDEVVEGNVQIG